MHRILRNCFSCLGSNDSRWTQIGVGQYCRSGNDVNEYEGIMTLEKCQSYCEEAVLCQHIIWNAKDDSPGCALLDCIKWGIDTLRPTQQTWKLTRGKYIWRPDQKHSHSYEY